MSLPDDIKTMLNDADFTDEQLAGIANVDVTVITAARAANRPPEPPAAPTQPAAEPEPEPPTKRKPKPPPAAKVEAEPEPEPEPPPTVRVVVSEAFLTAPGVRGPRRIAYRDVYSGDFAAFLWTAHRDLVEPYPRS